MIYMLLYMMMQAAGGLFISLAVRRRADDYGRAIGLYLGVNAIAGATALAAAGMAGLLP